MAENIRIVDGINPTSTEVHCPGCGGTIGISYDPATMKMVCPFCGLSTQLPQPEEGTTVDELDFNSAMQRANVNWGRIKKLIVCSNCGGETLYDAEQITGACPFCGSTSVAPAAENEQIMAPGSVIPFSVTKEMAEQYYTNFLRRKHCVSKKIYDCKLDNLVGIYLPFWTFDSYTISSYLTEIVYSRYDVKYYKGVFGYTFDDIVVFASIKQRNPYIQRVQDFDFTKAVPYSPEYLAGFPAERYTIGINAGWERAKLAMPRPLEKAIKKHEKSLRGMTPILLKRSTNYYNVRYRYLLAPMYLGTYTFRKKTYQVAINGQTGKTYFDVPTYIKKLILLGVGLNLLVVLAYVLILVLFGK